jgi:hypothetical protein
MWGPDFKPQYRQGKKKSDQYAQIVSFDMSIKWSNHGNDLQDGDQGPQDRNY